MAFCSHHASLFSLDPKIGLTSRTSKSPIPRMLPTYASSSSNRTGTSVMDHNSASQGERHEAVVVVPSVKRQHSTMATAADGTSRTTATSWRSAYSMKLPPPEPALIFLGFNLCTILAAFLALIVVACPTLHAMRRLAISIENLLKIARQELPGTRASIRLSGLEINNLTEELCCLRGLNKTYRRGQTRSSSHFESQKEKDSPIMN